MNNKLQKVIIIILLIAMLGTMLASGITMIIS